MISSNRDHTSERVVESSCSAFVTDLIVFSFSINWFNLRIFEVLRSISFSSLQHLSEKCWRIAWCTWNISNVEDHLVTLLVFDRRPQIRNMQAESVRFLSFWIISLTALTRSRSFSIIHPIARLKRWIAHPTTDTPQMLEMALLVLQLFVIINMMFYHFFL